VSHEVLSYVKKWIPYPRIGVLAGNSIHADRSFLVEEMPELIEWLHYRCHLFLFLLETSEANELHDISSIVGESSMRYEMAI